MRIELPYVTVTVDDGVRDRLALAGDRLRVTLTGYLRNAADDVDGLGRRASSPARPRPGGWTPRCPSPPTASRPSSPRRRR